MRQRRARRDMAPTASQLGGIRRSIKRTAARFHHRLSLECIEDLVQEVLLRLWKSGVEGRLRDSPAYVWRVTENTTIDMLRRGGAKKRQAFQNVKVNPRISQWQPPHTPEEFLIAREEAERLLETDHALRRRVTRTISRYFPRGLDG